MICLNPFFLILLLWLSFQIQIECEIMLWLNRLKVILH